jgi:hypothetical protein
VSQQIVRGNIQAISTFRPQICHAFTPGQRPLLGASQAYAGLEFRISMISDPSLANSSLDQ